jgi:hypothetical protein
MTPPFSIHDDIAPTPEDFATQVRDGCRFLDLVARGR